MARKPNRGRGRGRGSLNVTIGKQTLAVSSAIDGSVESEIFADENANCEQYFDQEVSSSEPVI